MLRAALGRTASLGLRLGRALFTTPVGITSLGSFGVANYYLQEQFGSATDFFHHEFITTKDPDAVQDFYSTEDFLQILGIFPIAIHFVLAGVQWDTNTENSMDVWNSMQISFDITEKEVEGPDGKDVLTLFNKRERFKNYVPLIKSWMPILLWDQVQDYGFERMPDGKLKVQHHGESFYGPWPVRLLVQMHARYVIWATERHINSEVFASGDLEAAEHHRSNIPLVAAKEFITALRVRQEAELQKRKLAGHKTEILEANLQRLKRMETTAPNIKMRRRGSQLVLKMDDPEEQAAVRAAIADEGRGPAFKETLQQLMRASGST